MNDIRPFHVDVPEASLAALRSRLASTRWPDEAPEAGWSYGVPVSRVRELAEYWRTDYDWRAHEARLNAFPQYTTSIDGQNIHFLHVRSPEPSALPLILSHGWPSAFYEPVPLIALLTDPGGHGGDPADAFDVVISSLPGYGFSAPLEEPGSSVASQRCGRP
jgi:epoxide hydrolase